MTTWSPAPTPELELELVSSVHHQRYRARLPHWDPRLWGRGVFSKNTRLGKRLLERGLAWGHERAKCRKVQQENDVAECEIASDTSYPLNYVDPTGFTWNGVCVDGFCGGHGMHFTIPEGSFLWNRENAGVDVIKGKGDLGLDYTWYRPWNDVKDGLITASGAIEDGSAEAGPEGDGPDGGPEGGKKKCKKGKRNIRVNVVGPRAAQTQMSLAVGLGMVSAASGGRVTFDIGANGAGASDVTAYLIEGVGQGSERSAIGNFEAHGLTPNGGDLFSLRQMFNGDPSRGPGTGGLTIGGVSVVTARKADWSPQGYLLSNLTLHEVGHALSSGTAQQDHSTGEVMGPTVRSDIPQLFSGEFRDRLACEL